MATLQSWTRAFASQGMTPFQLPLCGPLCTGVRRLGFLQKDLSPPVEEKLRYPFTWLNP